MFQQKNASLGNNFLDAKKKKERKRQLEIDNESQKGALDKFFFKEPNISVENNQNKDNRDHEIENLGNEQPNQVEEYISIEDEGNFDHHEIAFVDELGDTYST